MEQCSRCGAEPRRRGQRWGNRCFAESMRRTRPKHRDLPPDKKLKAVCRAYTGVLVKRGVIPKQPCERCGGTKGVEAHHPDYTKPRKVVWLCRPHHLSQHRSTT